MNLRFDFCQDETVPDTSYRQNVQLVTDEPHMDVKDRRPGTWLELDF